MPTTADFFGPDGGLGSNDFLLYMEGSLGPTDTPQRLKSHALTDPNTETRDALNVTTTDVVDGRIVLLTEVKYPQDVTYFTYTLGYPQKAITSPAMKAADRPGGCTKTFYRRFLCPSDPQFEHWIEMPDAILAPSQYADALITNNEDRNLITKTSEMRVPRELIGWRLLGNIVNTQASKKINGSSFLSVHCPGCNDEPGQQAIIVGGDGTAAPTVLVTTNRFGTVTSKSVGTTGDMGTDAVSIGDNIIVSTVTAATYAAATAGKLFLSTDRLATAGVAVSGMTDALRRLVAYENYVFGVGKDATGNAVLWYSFNAGLNWTKSTSSALPTGSALLDAAWDPKGNRLYMVGEDGVVLVGIPANGAIQITSLTSVLADTGADMQAIAVLGKNNVLIGGTLGHAWETRDGGASWTSVSISGTTAITSLDGNQMRVLVGAGTNVYERSHLTDNRFTVKPLQYGSLAGVVASVTMLPGNVNLWIVTTLNGETALFTDPVPVAA